MSAAVSDGTASSPPGPRYWLQDGSSPPVQVTKAEYVAAERAAGFRNPYGRSEDPACASWSAGHMSGRIEYRAAEPDKDNLASARSAPRWRPSPPYRWGPGGAESSL